MSRRRWIADRTAGDRAFLTGNNAEHLARVLRARVGQEFEISTGETVRLGRVVSVTADCVEFELGQTVVQPASPRVTVLLAVFKFDRMEWAIEKATELGVAAIVPVICRRTDAHLVTAAPKRVERWRRIAHEAAQQSRRASPPEIADPLKLKDALADFSDRVCRIVLGVSEQGLLLKDAVSDRPATSDRSPATVLAVGPEGGWTDDEFKLFAHFGWTSASLGPTILRAETAAIAAVAVTVAVAGDQ